ncbi:MAG TPA: hypothetical protein VEJ43_08785 [Pseudolabrys sp.]|nr:hypothetical protein [Pseudolabrys sp.]
MPQSEAARRSISHIETSMLFIHRVNIERYKKLLAGTLSKDGRVLLEARIAEEESALAKLKRELETHR